MTILWTSGVQSIEELVQKLALIDKDIAAFREQRDSLNEEARKWSEKRNEFHQRIISLREEAEKLRNIRDELNARVKELKIQRDSHKTIVTQKRQDLLQLREKVQGLSKMVPTNERIARKKFEQLEWALQTNPVKVKDERAIIEQVKELEKQLAVHRVVKEHQSKLMEIKLLLESSRLEMSKQHEELSRVALDSQKTHQKMLEMFAQMNELKAEADKSHHAFVGLKTKASEAHKKFIESLAQKKIIEQQIRQHGESVQTQRVKKVLEIKEEFGKQAEEKLKRGDKLTFEEFKILLEKGRI